MRLKQRQAISKVLTTISHKRPSLQEFLDEATQQFKMMDVLSGDEEYKPLLEAMEGIYCGEAGEVRTFIERWQCWLVLQWYRSRIEVAYLS